MLLVLLHNEIYVVFRWVERDFPKINPLWLWKESRRKIMTLEDAWTRRMISYINFNHGKCDININKALPLSFSSKTIFQCYCQNMPKIGGEKGKKNGKSAQKPQNIIFLFSLGRLVAWRGKNKENCWLNPIRSPHRKSQKRGGKKNEILLVSSIVNLRIPGADNCS